MEKPLKKGDTADMPLYNLISSVGNLVNELCVT
jgi:hypothetical protein